VPLNSCPQPALTSVGGSWAGGDRNNRCMGLLGRTPARSSSGTSLKQCKQASSYPVHLVHPVSIYGLFQIRRSTYCLLGFQRFTLLSTILSVTARTFILASEQNVCKKRRVKPLNNCGGSR